MTDTRTALEVLKSLMSNEQLALGDLVYNIREREGQGWDGPAVKQWSDDVVRAEALVKEAQ